MDKKQATKPKPAEPKPQKPSGGASSKRSATGGEKTSQSSSKK